MQNLSIGRVSRQELKREIEIIDLLIVIVFVALAIISLVYYGPLKAQIGSKVETYGFIGLFLISAIMEFLPQVVDNIFPMIVLIGLGFNVHLTILVTCVGSIIGSIAGFEIGRKYGYNFISSIFDDNAMLKIEKFMKKYGNLCVTLGAITPAPYIPLIFGAFGQKRKDFFIWGIIPRLLYFIFVGYAVYLGFIAINL